MRIGGRDTGYVHARRIDVHPLLCDVAGYGVWWPGVSATGDGTRASVELRPPGWRSRRQRLLVTVIRVRRDKGLRLRYRGDLDGEAEWYYLDERAGTTVHYVLRAQAPDRGAARRLADHRAAVRAGLHALAERLEGNRPAGAEPDPALVAHQARAARQLRPRRTGR